MKKFAFVSSVLAALAISSFACADDNKQSPVDHYRDGSVSVLGSGSYLVLDKANAAQFTGGVRLVHDGYMFGLGAGTSLGSGNDTLVSFGGTTGYVLPLDKHFSLTPYVGLNVMDNTNSSQVWLTPVGGLALETFLNKHVMFEPFLAGGAMFLVNGRDVHPGQFTTGYNILMVF